MPTQSSDENYKRAPLESMPEGFMSRKNSDVPSVEDLSEIGAGERINRSDSQHNQQNKAAPNEHSAGNLLHKLLPAGIAPDTLLIGAMILLLLSEHGDVAESDDDLLLLLGLLLFVK